MSVRKSDKCNEFKIYYLAKFREECERFKKSTNCQSSQNSFPNVFSFTKSNWVDFLRTLNDLKDKIHFIFSMFITIAVDQTMYCHFSDKYPHFQEHTCYPKFRYNNRGSNKNPFYLLKDAVDAQIVSYDDLSNYFRMVARVFIHEVHDYLDDYWRERQNDLNVNTFMEAFVNDKDIYGFCFEEKNPLSDFSRPLLVLSAPFAIKEDFMNVPHSNWADLYDFAYELEFGNLYQNLTDLTLKTIGEIMPPQTVVADFGAGTGRLAIPLSQLGYEVHAIEPCQEMIEQLREKDKDSLITNIHIKKMEDFSGFDAYFDLALSLFTVIVYILDESSLKRSFSAVARCLKKDGKFFIDVPLRGIFRSHGRNSAEGLREVTIVPDPENPDIYTYNEHIIRNSDNREVRESFKIRYWEPDFVEKCLCDNGFILEKDFTENFRGMGSNYWLLRKK
ncbi:MAG: class I SAM-dependent methyltransferase [Acidobacteriota bacterium]